jgi:hypothetical protein
MKNTYFPIGVYESYLDLMDRAEDAARESDISEWFIADGIQRYNSGVRSEDDVIYVKELLDKEVSRIAGRNDNIVVSAWKDIEKCGDFQYFFDAILKEIEERPKLGNTLRNISAHKLGVSKTSSIIDNAYKYAVADMAITYDFACEEYARILHSHDVDVFEVARKYAPTFLRERPKFSHYSDSGIRELVIRSVPIGH